MERISIEEKEDLLNILKERFENNPLRHKDILWANVLEKLLLDDNKIISLYKMEKTDEEPDVVLYDKNSNEFIFYDCSKESPILRRSFCYDREALESRKSNKPENSVMEMINDFQINLLTEEEYKYLQSLEEFDLKTSSWLKTDTNIRSLGGAIFGDRRYNRVFIYHNGAESYYSSRGFRGSLRV